MRYLVTARVKTGRLSALRGAIRAGSLGAGSVAGDEYLRDMARARELADGRVKWVETCFCPTPLAEERSYREKYFDLLAVKDAHARSRCRDENCGIEDTVQALRKQLVDFRAGTPQRDDITIVGMRCTE